MGLTVVDASVAAEWVLKEPDSLLAVALLGTDDPPHAPELIAVEGAGAVTRAFHNGRISLERVTEALDAWSDLLATGSVRLAPNGPDLRRAAEISCGPRHPIPDCLYLALAERLGAELVTADTAFVGRATAVWPHVRLLGA